MELLNKHLLIDLILDESGDFSISSSGDLSITNDGRKSLLQDIKHILETMPGDLYSHPEFGSGIKRFSGEDLAINKNVIIKSIKAALFYTQSIISRINPSRITFNILENENNSESELVLELELNAIKEIIRL